MKKFKGTDWVRLGPGFEIDETARLGVPSGRRIAPKPLIIGPQARLRSNTVIYRNSRIGNDFETGHGVIVREENQIGHHVRIWNYTTIDYGCRIGNRVKIHSNVYIAQYSVIEEDVFIAPGVVFTNDLFPRAAHADQVLQGPIIKKGAAIGGGSVLLPGVVIGEGAVIGAGSVVTRSVPARAVVWGSPAVVMKDRAALRWPEEFPLGRRQAKAFYRRRLAGRPAYE